MAETGKIRKPGLSRKARQVRAVVLLVVLLGLLGCALALADRFNLLPQREYDGADFNITAVKSPVDYNGNGVDDYTDILLGARADAENKPTYDGRYWPDGGYPPENIGVCTDVVWRAFKNAGYSLRDMVDNDIMENPELYPDEARDRNIDFRQVRNLSVFFGRYAQNLTLDPDETDQWQPGDIVIFENRHIAIASDKRNKKGQVYIIHNGGQPMREENGLVKIGMEITGHYRFDASRIPEDVLRPF